MRLQVTSVLLALFAGCTARAGLIQFNGLITGGEATYYYTYQNFTATVQGPELTYTFVAHGDPLYGVWVGGTHHTAVAVRVASAQTGSSSDAVPIQEAQIALRGCGSFLRNRPLLPASSMDLKSRPHRLRLASASQVVTGRVAVPKQAVVTPLGQIASTPTFWGAAPRP